MRWNQVCMLMRRQTRTVSGIVRVPFSHRLLSRLHGSQNSGIMLTFHNVKLKSFRFPTPCSAHVLSIYMPNGCRLNRHFNLKNTGSWTFCRQQNSVTFCHPKTIQVSKIFYFFRKSRKIKKKGLRMSIRTHMAHLNMLVVGYMAG